MPGEAYFSDTRFKDEIEKCQFCEEKPCKKACPADCSPADFIMAVSTGMPSDYVRAARSILKANPLGEICGLVCPDSHCMRACVQKLHGDVLDIPKIQATIVKKARELKTIDLPETQKKEGKRIAVIGAGPAGLAATAVLSQKGYQVTLFDSAKSPGGACELIPDLRLPKKAMKDDVDYIFSYSNVETKFETTIKDPASLLTKNFNAVLVSTGLSQPFSLTIPGNENTIPFDQYLSQPERFKTNGTVAIIGGGAVAADCALIAKETGASRVEMFVLENLDEMPLDPDELRTIVDGGIDVTSRTKLISIQKEKKQLSFKTIKVRLKEKGLFSLDNLIDEKGSEEQRQGFEQIVVAIGAKKEAIKSDNPAVFTAGDYELGPSSVVEAVASGKNMAAEIDAFLNQEPPHSFVNPRKSHVVIPGFEKLPVDVSADFFGRKMISPFLLAAAPPTDGLDQMKKAYEAGWPGGVMKTAFDNVPIHIPGEYMFTFDKSTYANCDNVSGHSLERVCKEVETLVKEFPDHLTLASTGGPVTGDDEADSKGWQSNTKKLENSGVMGIEYSLSCPQGGDGTKGDIVSQDPELTAKIIDWILSTGDPNIPKLFKLTPAVTSIKLIMIAIQDVLKRHPKAKAGVTLANTFPVLTFRQNPSRDFDEGIVVGMSGSGVKQISCLTLANVASYNVPVSGNGGAMNYVDAVQFLALGAKTVQFCTIVLKHGYSIIDHLHAGLSYYLKDQNIDSVEKLIGKALPDPITGFGDLSPVKKLSDRNQDMCVSCGNCTRCPYLAISMDKDQHPITDPSRCVGCGLCAQKCFTGALFMRDRTAEETSALRED